MGVRRQEGNRNAETFQKPQQEDAPRGKRAEILLIMKGNMREVKIQQRKYSHQPREKLSTGAKDRREEEERRKREQQQKQENSRKMENQQQQMREEERREKAQKEERRKEEENREGDEK